MSASLHEDMHEIESLHISRIFALVVQEFEKENLVQHLLLCSSLPFCFYPILTFDSHLLDLLFVTFTNSFNAEL
jgi:hypothetical protein